MLFHLRIQIKGIKSPPVWREVVVPETFTFERLHKVIQAAFDWRNAHLYLFSKEGFVSSPWIKVPDEADGEDDVIVYDSRRTKIRDYIFMWQRFYYIYDFGDDWQHEVKMIRIIAGTAKQARLIDGKGACPPEDCGGAHGYEHLKEVLKQPESEEVQELLAWTSWDSDTPFDPKVFDKETAMAAVASV